MLLAFLSCFSLSALGISQLSVFSLQTNLTISAKSSISLRYERHPLILGIRRSTFSNLKIQSVLFRELAANLFYGKNSANLIFSDVIVQKSDMPPVHIDGSTINDAYMLQDQDVLITNCKFEECIFFNDNGGALEMTNTTLTCKFSSFFFCGGNVGGVMYAEISNMSFSNSNFSSNYGNSAAVLAQKSSYSNFKECFFKGNYAKTDSVMIIEEGEINIETCYFVSNFAEYHTSLFLKSASATFRESEFYHNICELSNLINDHIGVVCCDNPKKLNILNCKFAENLCDNGKSPDIDIYAYGSGIVNIRFCKFDKNPADSVKKQQNDNLKLILTNCVQDLNMEMVSKDINEDASMFSGVFIYDFTQSNFLAMTMLGISITLLLIILVCIIFSCIDSLF